MRWVGIVAGIVGAIVGASVVRAVFKGGVSPKDLRPHAVAGLSIQFPAAPQKLEIELPAAVRSKILSTESYQYKARNFEAVLSRVVYVVGIQASPEGALEGALANVASSQSMTRVREDKKAVNVSGCDGLRFTALFSKSGKDVEAQGVILARGPSLWSVFVVYLKENSNSRETATLMVDSIRLAP
jgi:hypothetical protein